MRKNEDFGSAGGLFEAKCGDGIKAEKKSEAVEVEVTVIQTHVNLKIQCQRRPGQLLHAIVALEDLRLTILHLNITSSQASVLYSFNLKVLFCLFASSFFIWSTHQSGIKSVYCAFDIVIIVIIIIMTKRETSV